MDSISLYSLSRSLSRRLFINSISLRRILLRSSSTPHRSR